MIIKSIKSNKSWPIFNDPEDNRKKIWKKQNYNNKSNKSWGKEIDLIIDYWLTSGNLLLQRYLMNIYLFFSILFSSFVYPSKIKQSLSLLSLNLFLIKNFIKENKLLITNKKKNANWSFQLSYSFLVNLWELEKGKFCLFWLLVYWFGD